MDEYYARRNRLQPLRETLRKIYEAGWEAEAIFDSEISKLLNPLENHFKELFVAIEAYFGEKYCTVNRVGETIGQEWLEPYYHRIYGPGDDEISHSVDASVSTLATHLKIYLK